MIHPKRQAIIVYYFNTLSAPYRHQSGARSPSHRTPPVARRTFLRKLRHRALLGSIPTSLMFSIKQEQTHITLQLTATEPRNSSLP